MIKKKLHLCLLCPGYPPEQHAGGIGTFAFEAVKALTKFPIKITVVSRSDKFFDSKRRLSKDVFLYRIGELSKAKIDKKFIFRNNGYHEYSRRLLETIIDIDKKNKIDIIEACDWGAEAYFLLKKFNDRLIIRCQTPSFISEKFNPNNPNYLSKGLKLLEKKLFKSAPILISANMSLINEVSSEISISGRIIIEESPINLENIPGKKDYSFKSVGCRILVVGRIEERKGQDILFKAMEKINGNASLHVIGADTPGRFGKSTKELFLEKINPETRRKIVFLNELPRKKLLNMYKEYDIFVAPSRFDLGPFTLVEAMQAGVPSVGYNRHGVKEKIEDGKSGLLFNGTVNDLAKKILLLMKNESLRKKIGKSGQARVKKFYSSSVLSAAMFNTYQRFIEERLLQLSRQRSLEIISKNKNIVHDSTHLFNVEENCLKIASTLNLSQHELLLLRLSAHWHDTGRIDYSDKGDHEKNSIIYFKKWATNERIDGALINSVIKIISQHRNRGGRAFINNKLSKVFWDADKLDIFNLDRIEQILTQYKTDQSSQTEFNYLDSFYFWKNIDISFVNKFNTRYAKDKFIRIFPAFKNKVNKRFKEEILQKKKLVCMGGAEPTCSCFIEVNKQILDLLPKKKKIICYLPIALFNQPKSLEGMNSYIDQVERYYKNIDSNVIISRVSPGDKTYSILKKINNADIIYISGGDTKYLIKKLQGGIGKEIKKVYKNGKIIIGNSAGALAVLGDTYSIDNSLNQHYYKGLSLVSKYILLVHYSKKLEKIAKSIQSKHAKRKVLNLQEDQAIFLINGDIVKKYN